MDYELAQQLKEAGFPQKGDGKPSLSELIEACGDTLTRLSCINRKWETNSFIDLDTDEVSQGKGSTPEKAVAKLYIALNKNGTTK